MGNPPFTGVGVALVTLFTEDAEVDVAATTEHACRLVDLGVRALIVAGSTGEASSLNHFERDLLLAEIRRAVPSSSGVAVVAGTGAPSARQAVRYTNAACDLGADALLVLSPPGSVDVRPYYHAVRAAAGDVPVLAYHFPAVSPPGIPVPVLRELPVAGCKDSSGDPARMLETLTTWDRPLYVGSPMVLDAAGRAGCAGAILALANVEPELCIQAFSGDTTAQLKLTATHLASRAPFPGGIKAATSRRFGTSAVCRMG